MKRKEDEITLNFRPKDVLATEYTEEHGKIEIKSERHFIGKT